MFCFPEVLSEGLFSFRKGKECCALSFGAIIKPDGSIDTYEVANSTIKPTDAIAYQDVAKAVDDGDEDLKELLKISKNR